MFIFVSEVQTQTNAKVWPMGSLLKILAFKRISSAFFYDVLLEKPDMLIYK